MAALCVVSLCDFMINVESINHLNGCSNAIKTGQFLKIGCKFILMVILRKQTVGMGTCDTIVDKTCFKTISNACVFKMVALDVFEQHYMVYQMGVLLTQEMNENGKRCVTLRA